MYLICYDDISIAAPDHPSFSVLSGKLKQKINTADEFVFTLPRDNPYISDLKVRDGIVRLKREGQTIFAGDIINIHTNFDKSVEYTCQGCIAWLHDVVSLKFRASALATKTYFQNRLTRYNAQCAAERQMIDGDCTVGGNITVDHNSEYTDTFDLIAEMVAIKGGQIVPRYVGDDIYIDYLSSREDSKQEIRFGKNLLDLDKYISAENLATAVYPLGNDGLNITAVSPDSQPFISNTQLTAKYGKISKTLTFDTDDPQTLYDYGNAALNALAVVDQTITLTALDLSIIDKTVDMIEVGQTVNAVSPQHGLDTAVQATEKTLDICNPSKDSLTLGKSLKSITGIVASGNAGGVSYSGGGGGGGGGGASWDDITDKPFDTLGDSLKVNNRALEVNSTDDVEQDNTLPITSSAVYTTIGNIKALLETI